MEGSLSATSQKFWMKRVLVPFWVFQTIFSLIMVGLFAWIIQASAWTEGFGGTIADTVYLVLNVICLTFNIAEIALFARGYLRPGIYLGLNIAKTALWTIVLIMEIIGASMTVRNQYGSLAIYTVAYLVIVIFTYMTFLGSLIYASVVHYRHMRAKKAAKASQPLDHFTEVSPSSAFSDRTYVETKNELSVPNKGMGVLEAGGDPSPTLFEALGKPLQPAAELDSPDGYGAHEVGYDEVYEMGYSNTRPNSERRLTGHLSTQRTSERRKTGEQFLGSGWERGQNAKYF